MPISGSWGYKKSDTNFKSIQTLIRNLVDIASKGGNYLLNVSPTGKGTLLPEATQRLQAMGQWMKVNSASIYGTTGSPFGKLDWGRCTKKEFAKGTTLYLHVFDWPEDGKLFVPGLNNKIEQSYLLDGWQALETNSTEAGVTVSLPAEAPDEHASVVVVEVHGKLDITPVLPKPSKDGSLELLAEMAYLHNNEGSEQLSLLEEKHGGDGYLSRWSDVEAWAEWSFTIDQPGTYNVSAEVSLQEKKSRFRFGLQGQLQSVEVESTGKLSNYTEKSLGTIKIEKAGDHTLLIKPEKDGWKPMNLKKIVLKAK